MFEGTVLLSKKGVLFSPSLSLSPFVSLCESLGKYNFIFRSLYTQKRICVEDTQRGVEEVYHVYPSPVQDGQRRVYSNSRLTFKVGPHRREVYVRSFRHPIGCVYRVHALANLDLSRPLSMDEDEGPRWFLVVSLPY